MVCVDARHSKKALAGTQTQVGPLQVVVALTSKFLPRVSESIDAVDGAWSQAYLGHNVQGTSNPN